jgi:hypothetical protein
MMADRERGNQDLVAAFDAAIDAVGNSVRARMKAADGEPAEPQLRKLGQELKDQRASAIERGDIDREWFQRTMRWLVGWLPETEPKLIAAMGRIARAAPPPLS